MRGSIVRSLPICRENVMLLLFLMEIVKAILDNYEPDKSSEGYVARREAHHNWVDEVVRCEGQGSSGVGSEINSSCVIIRPRPEKRDPCLLTREEPSLKLCFLLSSGNTNLILISLKGKLRNSCQLNLI